MKIEFLGTSCMVPTKERNHIGIFISHQGEGVLVDCGEGTQRQLKIADIKPTSISSILITHWHGDHVFGLPGLLQTLNSSEYPGKMKIFGPLGTKKNMEHMFNAFSFRIEFEHEILEISNSEFGLKNFAVLSRVLEHRVPCIGYSLKENDKRKIRPNVVKRLGIPDGPLLGELQNNKEIVWKNRKVSPEEATYVVKGKKVAIVLDTALCNNIFALSKDADLLICEASYSSELERKAQEYMHLTSKQAAHIASDSNVGQLVLAHISQRYKTPQLILEEAKEIFENVSVAHDFMKIKI